MTHPDGTETTCERIERALIECWANTPAVELAGLSPWEAALSPAGHVEVAAMLRQRQESVTVVARYLGEASRPLTAGRCVGCFEVSGGLLNVFNEPYGAEDDEAWPRLVAERVDRVAFISAEARDAALREAARAWDDTPSELFSGLTPAQVWAGGGEREARLLRALADDLKKKPVARIEAPGDRIRDDLFFLRKWLAGPHDGTRDRAVDVVHAERSLILRRKRLLASSPHEARQP